MSHFRTSTTTGEGKQRGGGKIRLPSSEGRFSPPHLLTFSLLVSSRCLSHEWGVECTGEALLEKLLSCSPRSTSHVLTFSPSHFHTSIHPRHLACVRVPTQGFSHHCGCFDRPGPRPLCYTARLTPPLIPPPLPYRQPVARHVRRAAQLPVLFVVPAKHHPLLHLRLLWWVRRGGGCCLQTNGKLGVMMILG